MSAPSGRATVEDVDDEDPYAPYQPRQSSQPRQTASAASSSSASSGPSSTARRSATESSNSRPSNDSAYTSSGRSDARPSAADTYNASPSSGGQSGYPREGGDEEPLLGGRPFRQAHSSAAEAAQDPDSDTRAADKDHLYAILNIPSDASADQIKESYRSLAVVLHPDKHNDPSRKSAAESQFREVQRAYEILSDPEKRAVYDFFGEEGLKSTWTVSLRGRSPQEMQAEFERERMRRQAADAEALVKSKGDFTAHIDASALFAQAARIPRPQNTFGHVTLSDRINRIGCTQLIGKHGFETQVTNQTAVTFSGQMVSRNGMGGGNLVGTVKTHWSPRLFTDVTMSFLRPQIITTKGQYTLDSNSFFTWQGTLQTLMVPPSFNVTYGQRLSSKSTLTGFTSIRSGTFNIGAWGAKPPMMFRREPAAVAVGLTRQTEEGKGWTAQTGISTADQNISIDWSTKVLSGVKVRTGFNLGTASGVSAFSSAERRLTENVRLSLGINCSLPAGGVTLRIKVNRLGQKIMLPIMLSPDFRSDLVVMFTALPVATYTALHYGYFEPRKKKRLTNRLGELRRANREMILERRQAALEALSVLRDQAIKKAEAELRKSGVVIVEAWYGRLETFPPSNLLSSTDIEQEAGRIWNEEKHASSSASTTASSDLSELALSETFWDVRVPLQALVNKGQIIVPGNRSKAHLLGFHDPVLGEKKHVLIRYVFRGTLHQVVVEDFADLALPMRLHQL